jgi:hypothetical protein
MFECNVAQAIALSSAVSEQLSVDACARTFTLKAVAAVDSVQCLLEGGAVSIVRSQADLYRQLSSPGLELKLAGADRIDLTSFDLSMLSAEALDEIRAGASFSIDSEDALSERLLSLGDEYLPLLSRIAIRFLRAAGLAILAEHFVFPPECVFCGILDSLIPPPPPSRWNSAIVADFPELFDDFKQKQFTLLWRGSRDGFRARNFHRRCDGHPNTLTVILDTDGNIFGGFTPVEWESPEYYKYKADPRLKSFIFTLKNPHTFPPRRFPLREEKKEEAIRCHSNCGPHLGEIMITDNCNANADNSTFTFRPRRPFEDLEDILSYRAVFSAHFVLESLGNTQNAGAICHPSKRQIATIPDLDDLNFVATESAAPKWKEAIYGMILSVVELRKSAGVLGDRPALAAEFDAFLGDVRAAPAFFTGTRPRGVGVAHVCPTPTHASRTHARTCAAPRARSRRPFSTSATV